MRAEFGGWCLLCDEAIRRGDDIRKLELQDDDERWVHVECLADAERQPDFEARERSRPRCLLCADLVDELGRCPNCEA